MPPERSIGYEIKTLSNLMKRRINKMTGMGRGSGFTHMHRLVVRFLAENQQRDVFQRDIESEFHIRRSTVTGLLQRMERSGLIHREPVAYDARLKKITLTQKSIDIHNNIKREIENLENRFANKLTDAEIDSFFALTAKIKRNIEQDEP